MITLLRIQGLRILGLVVDLASEATRILRIASVADHSNRYAHAELGRGTRFFISPNLLQGPTRH
jgi:hypothetical protein